MGLIFTDVVFEDPAPSLPEICTQIESICHLPVVVQQIDEDDEHRLRAFIAFTSQPESKIEICIYDRDALRAEIDASFEHPAHSSLMKGLVTAANSQVGTQTVQLRGFAGQERTLMTVTNL